jgi:hypothetical protein
MIDLQQTKKLQLIWPQARINNSAVTSASVDRRGFNYATLRVAIGATDIGFTTFKLQESDDNSTFTDVPSADFSISPLTLPAGTNSNTLWEWQIDLRAPRKRYLKPAITIGNGSAGAFVSATAELSRAEQAPATPTAQGLTGAAVI